MADDFEKDKNKGEMNFEDEAPAYSEPQYIPKEENPFTKKNPFMKENNYSQDEIFEKKSDIPQQDKKPGKDLGKILLVLLLAIGTVVVAVFGLMNRKPDQQKKAPIVQNKSTEAQTKENSTETKNAETVDSSNVADPESYCRLSEALKYISGSMSNLDKIVGLAEERLEEIPYVQPASKQEDLKEFLKEKVDTLARAEQEIRAFSEPYFDKDSSLVYSAESTGSCKINEAPKYLYSWMEDIAKRIKNLDDSLNSTNLEAPKEVETIQESKTPPKDIQSPAPIQNKTTTNNTPQTKQSSPSNSFKAAKPKPKPTPKTPPIKSTETTDNSFDNRYQTIKGKSDIEKNQEGLSGLTEDSIQEEQTPKPVKAPVIPPKAHSDSHHELKRCHVEEVEEDQCSAGGDEEEYYYEPRQNPARRIWNRVFGQ
jgi:hypothetical protein